jgi:hypothetical protein
LFEFVFSHFPLIERRRGVFRDEFADSLQPHAAGAAELLFDVSRFSAVWTVHIVVYLPKLATIRS